MADGEGEDDEDFGAPPIVPGMRVWTNPGGGPGMSGTSSIGGAIAAGPITDDERERFGIPPPPSPAVAEAIAKIQANGGRAPSVSDANASIIEALVAKLPSFDPSWPAKTQSAWFKALEKIAGMK